MQIANREQEFVYFFKIQSKIASYDGDLHVNVDSHTLQCDWECLYFGTALEHTDYLVITQSN